MQGGNSKGGDECKAAGQNQVFLMAGVHLQTKKAGWLIIYSISE